MRRRRFQEGGLAALASDDPDEVMDPEGDEEDSPAGAVTASGGLTALDIPGAAEAFALMAKSSADARRALQQARESIMSRKYNKAHALLAASAALGAPTRAGSTAESFGAMAGALRDPLKEREAFEQGQTKDILGIDTSLAGLDEKQAQAQIALATLRAKLRNDLNKAPLERVMEPGQKNPIGTRRGDAVGKPLWVPEGTKVSIDQRGETKQSEVINEGYGKDYNQMQLAGRAAPVQIAEMLRLGDYLDGINTGKLAPAITELQSIGASLGIKVPNLGVKQAAEALSNGLALKLRNPAEGAGMPGALSNQDRNYLKQMVAGIGKSPEANKLMIQAAVALARRDQQVARRARAYLKKHKKMDEDFYDELEEWSEANPIFGEPKAAAAPDEADAGTMEPAAVMSDIPSEDDAVAVQPGTVSFHSFRKKQ
jgi:hypothetical protein